jgi:hypothetical protein
MTSRLANDPMESSKRALAPLDRISEVLFGLIMALTFTGSLSVAQAGRDDVRAMLVGAFGCNVAWGIIDGVFFLMGSLASKQSNRTMLRALRRATDSRKVAAALPPPVAAVLEPAMLDAIHARLQELPEPPTVARLDKRDLLGAVAVFLLVFLAMLPLTLPFFFIKNPTIALRVSNVIALVMLAVAGAAYGRLVGRSMWGFGVGMVVVGGLLVALAIALGG